MTRLELVYSVPLSLEQRKILADKKETYVSKLEQRLVDVAQELESCQDLLEASETVRKEQAQKLDGLRKRNEELEAQNTELKKDNDALVSAYQEARDTCAELRDVASAIRELAKTVEDRMRVVLGFEHADESLEKYELRRSLTDLIEALDEREPENGG